MSTIDLHSVGQQACKIFEEMVARLWIFQRGLSDEFRKVTALFKQITAAVRDIPVCALFSDRFCVLNRCFAATQNQPRQLIAQLLSMDGRLHFSDTEYISIYGSVLIFKAGEYSEFYHSVIFVLQTTSGTSHKPMYIFNRYQACTEMQVFIRAPKEMKPAQIQVCSWFYKTPLWLPGRRNALVWTTAQPENNVMKGTKI